MKMPNREALCRRNTDINALSDIRTISPGGGEDRMKSFCPEVIFTIKFVLLQKFLITGWHMEWV